VVWREILPLLESSPEIRKVCFQSKVANFFRFAPSDFAAMKNQHDRILFYFPEKGRSEALRIIQEYVSKNPQYFEPCHSLAAPLIDNKGKELNCAFASDESEISSFNGNHAQIIKEIIQDFASFYKLPNGKSPNIKEVLQKAKDDNNCKKILVNYMSTNYPQKSAEKGFDPDNTAFLLK
jgi:hypothetical protein